MNVRKNIDYSEMYKELDMLMAKELPQMELYCGIGKAVCRRTEKGAAVMASEYLNKRHPDVKGFSPRSLRRMRDFYRTYENQPALLSRAMNLGWIQNVVIMEADMTMDLREWYMKAAKQFGWSKTELTAYIAASAHLEIVLDNEEEICDNVNNEKKISYIPVKNDVQVFISKLFSGKLDDAAREFWKEKINKIKKQTLSWNWSGFDFDDFISKLSFENVKKATLENDIENALIKNWEIEIDNIALYANGIKLLCLDRMESGGDLTYDDVAQCIESIKFDISKGIQNPAHAWIRRIVFSKSAGYSSGYYEGKKATPADIANSLPIERPGVEKNVIESIQDNVITVIKTSSGQGKTTLALRSVLAVQAEYTPYELTWCNSESELGHIVEYFRMRTRIGEKPLILLDNLDSHLSKWNMLAQLMQASVTYHYRILITSRENDWYNYGGDVSNLHSINVIKPILEKDEAEAIYIALQKAGKLHPGISDWRESWSKISDRQLLIEYVYLLTHGEMIADRISAQMKEIGSTAASAAKFEILRKVCFADVCGIKLETRALIRSLEVRADFDPGEMLKSLMDEFLVHISVDGDYIEGLHPVRSQHIVNRLHEYMSLDETALATARIAAKADLSVLFSHYPEFDFDKGIFYSNLVTVWWDLNDLSRFVQALRGVFSGSVMQYYRKYKHLFDDAHEHGGLVLVLTDLCPFTKFQGYENEMDTLDKFAEMMPDNSNIQHMITIRDSIPKFTTDNTDVYFLSNALFQKLQSTGFDRINDVESYATIVDWLYNMDSALNLAPGIDLSCLWQHAESYSLKAVSSLMYSAFCGNKDAYDAYLKDNRPAILAYLKRKTKSHTIKADDRCIKVEYILRASEKMHGNEASVSRLKDICRILLLFQYVDADHKWHPDAQIESKFSYYPSFISHYQIYFIIFGNTKYSKSQSTYNNAERGEQYETEKAGTGR